MSDPLYDDPDLVSFYDLENGWGADFAFCARLAAGAKSVLWQQWAARVGVIDFDVTREIYAERGLGYSDAIG